MNELTDILSCLVSDLEKTKRTNEYLAKAVAKQERRIRNCNRKIFWCSAILVSMSVSLYVKGQQMDILNKRLNELNSKKEEEFSTHYDEEI